MTHNPWPALPRRAPFVLPADQNDIETFNSARSRRPEHRVRLDAVPVPFMGSPEAPVVLLNLNPGYDPGDVTFQEEPEFQSAFRANLEHARTAFPFFLLDPQLRAHPGYQWWTRRLSEPINYVGLPKAAARLLCVEWFPYASQSFSKKVPHLDSQEYGFDLVRQAIGRGAAIVLMRSRDLWESKVPALADYPEVFELRNPQNPHVSAANFPVNFKRLLERLAS